MLCIFILLNLTSVEDNVKGIMPTLMYNLTAVLCGGSSYTVLPFEAHEALKLFSPCSELGDHVC
jgi:hypothetical protein